MRGSGHPAELCLLPAKPLPEDGAPQVPADPRVCPPQVGRLHGSVPNLSRYLEPSQSQLPFSLPPEYSQLQRSFWVLAQKGGMGWGVLSPTGGPSRGRAGAGVPCHSPTACPCLPAVHGSLSSVVAALMAERARLEEMRQALDRRRSAPHPGGAGNTGVRDQPQGAGQGYPRLWVPLGPRGCCCWVPVGAAHWQGLSLVLGCPGSGGAISPPLPAPRLLEGTGWGGARLSLPPPLQAALRRFHSLSVSSDTTLDSFASLHPDEVRGSRGGVGWGGPGGPPEAGG